MHMANPLGLIALLAVPVLVLLHLYRQRPRVRRVAGVFLWAEPAIALTVKARLRSRLTAAALVLDLVAAFLLVLLVLDIRLRSPDQPDVAAETTEAVYRTVLCVAIAGLLAANWYQRTR